jgi:acyl-coenzyme A synthetase/AMP-(fatty) acid ligase
MSTGGIAEAVRLGPGAPDATAIVSEGRNWTFQALLAAAETLAEQLGRMGVTRRRPVIAEMSDPVATAVATLGCDLAGVPLIHRDPAIPEPAPGAITLHDGRTHTPGADERRLADTGPWLRDGAGSGDAFDVTDLPSGSQTFLTSGSTGTPTGVVKTAAAVLASARRVAAFLGYRPDTPVLTCAPLFHGYGFSSGLLAPLLAGAPTWFCSPRSVPSQLGRAARRHAAQTLIALPSHYGLIAGLPEDAARPPGDSEGLAGLRSCVSGGAPLATGVADRLLRRYSFTLYNSYGSSEVGTIAIKQVTREDDPGDVGTPLPGISARIDVAAETGDPARDGEAHSRTRGELLLSSDGLAMGRIGPDGLRPLDMTGGWYRTGDLASIDPSSGAIRLFGRIDTVINVAGQKVGPAEIERVLAAHPEVLDVQVLAASDRARGQVPVARVVLRDVAAEGALIGWCRERLAPHQVPSRIERVAAIPRSAAGKPLRGQGPS